MCSMTKYVFQSKFATQMASFVKMKTTMGCERRFYEANLYLFDSYLCEYHPNCDLITQEITTGWKETMANNTRGTIYHKYCVLNAFCRYLNHIGYPCYIPRLPKWSQSGFVPYIFTHDEITRMFNFLDNLRMKQHNGNCHYFCIPALFRLLYGTGLRMGEALSLKNRNVDLESRTILLEITKNNQHRMIPINDSLYVVLLQYTNEKRKLRRLRRNGPDDYFFVSVLGDDMRASTVHNYFKQALHSCGIPRNAGRIGPRVHDLRHTFAVHSLIQQTKAGTDLYCSLPILSVFLGHRDYRDTEIYVRLTIDMFPEIIEKEEQLLENVFPTSDENE